MRKRYYKTLETSVINSTVSPPSMNKKGNDKKIAKSNRLMSKYILLHWVDGPSRNQHATPLKTMHRNKINDREERIFAQKPANNPFNKSN